MTFLGYIHALLKTNSNNDVRKQLDSVGQRSETHVLVNRIEIEFDGGQGEGSKVTTTYPSQRTVLKLKMKSTHELKGVVH